MYVFDSYVNMFQPHSLASSNATHQGSKRRCDTRSNSALSETVSHTLYRFATQIDGLLHNKRYRRP